MKNLLRYIGLPHLKMKPVRSLLTLLGVAFGIALYVAIAIINQSTKNSMRESIEAVAGKAKLTITAGPVGFDEKYLETVKKTPGVVAAVPMVEARAFFTDQRETASGLYVMGVDLLQESAIRSYKTNDHKVIEDPLVFLNQPDSIIITEKLAKERGLEINSKLALATANGVKSFTVRGLLDPEGAAKAYGGSLAIMDIDGARLTFGKENKIDRIDIIPEPSYTVDQVKLSLVAALGSTFSVETTSSQSAQMDAMLGSYQIILTFFSSIALLAGLFLIINSVSIAVTERRKEIGTLRALGATRSSMIILFVAEVVGIGFFGSLLGCAIGRGLAELLSDQVVSAVAAQFQTQLAVNRLEFPLKDFIFAVSVGTGASILAALWPSLKAAQVNPLESMRGHPEVHHQNEGGFARRLFLFGLITIAFVTASSVWSWGKHSILLDLMTKGGSVIGAAVFGPIVVLGFLKLLEKLPLGTLSPTFHFALENMLKNPKRTISNAMALLVGLFLVMLIATIRTSFHDTLLTWLDKTFVSDILVSSSGRVVTAEVQPLNENIQEEILAIPGIRPIGENRGTGERIIRFNYHGKNVTLKAMDRFADFYEAKYIDTKSGDPKRLLNLMHDSTMPALLASEGFLVQQNHAVGDQIGLSTPNGTIHFSIAGQIADYAPDGVLYLDRKVYKRYWNDPLVSAFAFNVLPDYTVEQVRSNIDRTLGIKNNLVVVSNAEFKNQTQQAIEQSFAYTRAIELIALIVGLLGLLNTMLISVMERTREIGMLRAVGSTKSQIAKMIFWEAILQGFFGSIVAVVLGAYLGWLYVKYSLVDSLGWVIDYHFALAAVASTVVTGVIVAVIAGSIPSRRAANLDITDALDYE